MCIPLTYKGLLDNAFPNKDVEMFVKMICLMLVFYFVGAAFNVLKDYLLAKISENLCLSLRTQLNQKIPKIQYSYFDEHNVSDILSKFNREVDTIKENCGYMLIKTMSNLITFIMACTMTIVMEWRIMLFSFILLTVFIVNGKHWGKKVKSLAEKSMQCNEEAIGAITENFKNVLITKLYGAYEYVNKKFNTIYGRQYKNQMELEVTYSVNINLGGLITYFLSGVIWVIGGIGIFQGRLTIGTVTALINYQNMMIGSMAFFSEFNNSYQGTVIAMKRLYKILTYKEENNDGIQINDKIDSIKFQDVTFEYNNQTSVLEHVELELVKGKTAVFVGGSGCGKSTLVKMLLGLYPPAKGDISIGATSIRDISLSSLRDRIAFVAQDSYFYKGSIMDNMELGKHINETRLIEYSKLLDLYSEIMGLPEQWATELQSGTSNLSGGQRKRLDVLRALLKESDVIIFDESTASIDVERRKRLFEILNIIKMDKIIIFITHNTEECEYFDIIYAVKNKKVFPVEIQNIAQAY